MLLGQGNNKLKVRFFQITWQQNDKPKSLLTPHLEHNEVIQLCPSYHDRLPTGWGRQLIHIPHSPLQQISQIVHLLSSGHPSSRASPPGEEAHRSPSVHGHYVLERRESCCVIQTKSSPLGVIQNFPFLPSFIPLKHTKHRTLWSV